MRSKLPLVFILIWTPLFSQSATPTEPQASSPTVATQEANSTTTGEKTPPSDVRDPVYYPGDTERFKPLMHKLIANIWLDQKEIWTSPFRMNKGTAPLWLAFGAGTAALIATDHRTSDLLANSRVQVRWGNRISNVGASYTLIPLVAGFYGYGVLRDDPKPREVGVLGAEALLDSLILVQILKTAAGRQRPEAGSEKGEFFENGTSFPSGHSIESWALASLIAHEYKHTKLVPIVAYSLAGVVSAARFTAQKHFASDILAGGAMGWFIGRYVYKTHMDHAIHHNAWLNPQIVPRIEPGSRTFSVSLVFSGGR